MWSLVDIYQQCVCSEGTGSLYRARSRASSLLSTNHNPVHSPLIYRALCIVCMWKGRKVQSDDNVHKRGFCKCPNSGHLNVLLRSWHSVPQIWLFLSINKNNIPNSESLQGCWSNDRRSTVRDLPEKYFPVDDLGGQSSCFSQLS